MWIHDYHLFLVGDIFRSLDPSLDCGFFLHIPFGLSDEFMTHFPNQGVSVLRGMLGFSRVGFQVTRCTLLPVLVVVFQQCLDKQRHSAFRGHGSKVLPRGVHHSEVYADKHVAATHLQYTLQGLRHGRRGFPDRQKLVKASI